MGTAIRKARTLDLDMLLSKEKPNKEGEGQPEY